MKRKSGSTRCSTGYTISSFTISMSGSLTEKELYRLPAGSTFDRALHAGLLCINRGYYLDIDAAMMECLVRTDGDDAAGGGGGRDQETGGGASGFVNPLDWTTGALDVGIAGLEYGLFAIYTQSLALLQVAVSSGRVPIGVLSPPKQAAPTSTTSTSGISGNSGVSDAALLSICSLLAVVEVAHRQPSSSGGLAINPGRTVLLTADNTPPVLRPLVSAVKTLVVKIKSAEQGLIESALDVAISSILQQEQQLATSKPQAEGRDGDGGGGSASSGSKIDGSVADLVSLLHNVLLQVMTLPFATVPSEAALRLMHNSRQAMFRTCAAAAAVETTTTSSALSSVMKLVCIRLNDGWFFGGLWFLIDTRLSVMDVRPRILQLFYGDSAPTLRVEHFKLFHATGFEVTTLKAVHHNEVLTLELHGHKFRFHPDSTTTSPSDQVALPLFSSIRTRKESEGDVGPVGEGTRLGSAAAKATPFHRIPTVSGHPLIGNANDVRGHGIHAAMKKWGTTHGDIVSVNLLGNPTFIVRRASFALDVLQNQNKNAPDTNIGGGRNGLFFRGWPLPR